MARHLTVATLLVALAGLSASLAHAQPAMQHEHGGARHASQHRMGPGMAGGPMGGAMMAERALDEVGASAEQKARVREIYKAARDEMRQQQEGGRALHQQMLALMAAPQVDAAAAEGLRQQQLARHDSASKRMLQAMLEAQAVLTPEQRQKLVTRLQSNQDMKQRHRQERHSMEAPRS